MVTQREARRPQRNQIARQLANGLGWFSIGLGVAELVAPGQIQKLMGIRDRGVRRNVLRAYGVREIAAGVGILVLPGKSGWMWTRVAGDLVDLATLGSAFGQRDARLARLAAATVAVAGVTALDVLCSAQLSRGGPFCASSTVLIGRKPDELYPFWKDLSNVTKLEPFLESVRRLAQDRWRWRVRIGGGPLIEIDTEIVRDQPNRLIEWRSGEGSSTKLRSRIEFLPAPGDRGTLVRASIELDGPIMLLAKPASAAGFGPELRLEQHLRRFKQLMETGEIARATRDQAIPSGRQWQPAREPEPALTR
jgi:uncharacterized membrane protein